MIIEEFQQVRQHTIRLCKPLELEDYNLQAAEFVSPAKWHLAHTTWFFEEFILIPFLKDYHLFDNQFTTLFNSYYNHIGKRIVRNQRGLISRPSLERVLAYRTYVDQHIVELLSVTTSDEIIALLSLGMNHEQQHQELLLTDLKYSLSQNPISPIYSSENYFHSDTNRETGWVEFPAGIYDIGHKGEGFCYDNELGPHQVYLSEFKLSKALVTNGEFIDFIEAGGYQNFEFWLDEGWSWVQETGTRHPLYWEKQNGNWMQFTLAGMQAIDKSSILAHVSFYEAAAFAQWKGLRLPTEFEWEAAADKLHWGQRWEWTNSAYLAYPGFEIKEGAVGEYNGKFMINQMVLRGASSATSEGHSRKTYRNFFHPQSQWQFSGIRLAK